MLEEMANKIVYQIVLRFLWYMILSFIVMILAGILGMKDYIQYLLMAVFIFVLVKKVDVSKKNAANFLMKFWKTEKRVSMLSDDPEEAEQQINNLINKIKDGEYSLDVPIRLDDSEKSYFMMSNAEWHETRYTTKSISYGNIQQTFKITNGLKIRIGNIKPIPHKKSEFTLISQGDFYITNKRVLLVSPTETKKIEIRNILNINLFSDSILIQRDSGKAVLIPMEEDVAIVAKSILDNI